MGPLDVNMAIRPYSSCPLLSHFTLCISTRALDLYLVIERHGKSVLSIVLFLIVILYCIIVMFCLLMFTNSLVEEK
jgi:hypothetical protein